MSLRQPFTVHDDDGFAKELTTINTTAVPTKASFETEAPLIQRTVSTRRQGIYTFIDACWLWEVGAWVVSVISLIGLAELLRSVDGHPAPKWSVEIPGRQATKVQITLNAVVSVFTTVLKSALSIPVAASLSQQKWLWFDNVNKLSDFQQFDAANRGPLGSLLLIISMRGRRLACLGAFIIMGTLALDFSLQQLVSYRLQPVPSEDALMPQTSVYTLFSVRDDNVIANETKSIARSHGDKIRGAVWAGLWGMDGASQFAVEATCPNGTCHWSHPYASVGVCASCWNATNLLNIKCENRTFASQSVENATYEATVCNASLPSGASVNEPLEISLLNGTYVQAFGVKSDMNRTIDLNGKSWITAFSTINVTYTGVQNNGADSDLVDRRITDRTYSATECGLEMCVKMLSGTVSVGRTTETTIGNPYGQEYATVLEDPNDHISGYSIGTFTPPAEFFPSGYERTRNFSFDSAAYDTIQSAFFMNTPEVSRCQAGDEGPCPLTPVWDGWAERFTDDPTAASLTVNSTVMSRFVGLDFDGITQTMNNIADSVTKVIRSYGHDLNANKPVKGTAQTDIVFVIVRWYWIIYPATLLVLSFIFLSSTIFQTQQRKTLQWKGSALAPFFHPLTSGGRTALEASLASSSRQMEQVSEGMYVKWQMTERGYRLVPSERT